MSAYCVDFLVFSCSQVTPNTLLERDTKKVPRFFMCVFFSRADKRYNGVTEKPKKVSRG